MLRDRCRVRSQFGLGIVTAQETGLRSGSRLWFCCSSSVLHLWSASQRKLIVPRYPVSSEVLVVGVLLFLLLWARRPGIHYQTVFAIQH